MLSNTYATGEIQADIRNIYYGSKKMEKETKINHHHLRDGGLVIAAKAARQAKA